MSILPKLASALGRRDEIPNQQLAAEIVKKNDKKAVTELIENLNNKNKQIKSDCIKTLYEIGEIKPALISDHIPAFKTLLKHKDNRMIWGGMSALDRICSVNPAGIYKILPHILDAADTGTVITKDNAVSILTRLASDKRYANEALPLLLEQLRNCASNQLAMYAENAIAVIPDNHKKDFIHMLTRRIPGIEKETKQKRIEKVIKKLQGKT
jgi:uncharacterized protein YfcZ (UPF0381/DUF406 family)